MKAKEKAELKKHIKAKRAARILAAAVTSVVNRVFADSDLRLARKQHLCRNFARGIFTLDEVKTHLSL